MSIYSFPLTPLPNFVEFLNVAQANSPTEIQNILDNWKDEWNQEAVLEGDTLSDYSLRKSVVVPLEYSDEKRWLFDRLTSIIAQANTYYHFDLNGFYEPLQLAQYGVGDFFDWHLDFGTGDSSNRKLSMSIQLSDPDTYEGGDLEFHINNTIVKAPRTLGSAVIFPSFIRHRVSEITQGERRSIVGWVSGPPFK